MTLLELCSRGRKLARLPIERDWKICLYWTREDGEELRKILTVSRDTRWDCNTQKHDCNNPPRGA